MQKKAWKTKIGTKNKSNKQKAIKNIVDINPTISVITLNGNHLNEPIKRWRLSECIKKQDLTICCLQEIHLN